MKLAGPGLSGEHWATGVTWNPADAERLSTSPFRHFWDGNLFNRVELARQLGLPLKGPDPHVAASAFSRWGVGCLDKLEGDFVFAVWDPERQSLFAARDALGMRPFYYIANRRMFAFASEIRPLLALIGAPASINRETVADHLLCVPHDPSATFYQGVSALPAGHYLIAEKGRLIVRKFWALNVDQELDTHPSGEIESLFRSTLEDAVRFRLAEGGPTGVTLSGGLDSSTVLCIASDLQKQGKTGAIHSFSVRFQQTPECDEGGYIQAVLSRTGVPHTDVRGELISPLSAFKELLPFLEEPSLAQNLHLWLGLYQTARQCGVTVLLDGHDGDTAVSDGLGRLRELVAESDRLQFCYEAWLYSNRLNKRFWPYLRAILLPSLVPPLFREIGRDLRRGQLGQTDPPVNFLNPEFARETDAFGRNATRLAAPPQYTSQRERHVQRLTGGFGSHASTVLAKMGRGLGIDPRHPFYDRRFLELCVALPSEFKLKDGWTRYILRKSFERIVPDVVRWRPGKTRLGRQFDKAFRGPDAAALKEIVRDQDRLLEPFVNMVELRSLLDRYMQTGSDKEGTQLWAAATLAIWLRETRGTGVHA